MNGSSPLGILIDEKTFAEHGSHVVGEGSSLLTVFSTAKKLRRLCSCALLTEVGY